MSDCWTDEVHKKILDSTSSVLWRFIQKNAKLTEAEDICADLMNLSKKDLDLMTKIHFLLDSAVKNFINKTAPKILTRLSKTSRRRRRTSKGAVRGKVDVPATVKQQLTAGVGPHQFVAVDWSSSFDLVENRLMKYLLQKIIELSQGVLNKPLEYKDIRDENKKKWIDEVEIIGIKAQKLLKNVYLKQISSLDNISKEVIEEAEKTRGYWYNDLAKAAEFYFDVFKKQANKKFLKEILSTRFFEPLDWNVLYELYVLSEVITTAENAGWRVNKNKLIGGNSKFISEYMLYGKKLKIYYQKVPDRLKEASSYGELLDRAGLNASLRRPDIILELEGSERRFCIIEIKRSAAKSYLTDGVYKLMGYLKDFESKGSNLGLNGGINGVKGILIGWSGFNHLAGSTEAEIILAVKRTLKEMLEKLLIVE